MRRVIQQMDNYSRGWNSLFLKNVNYSISVIFVNDSFQARVVNSIPGLIHAHAINTKPNRIFSFFIPFPIPWGVILSKRSTEIIT